MHCCLRLSGRDSDRPRLPFPLPLPPFFCSGGLASAFGGETIGTGCALLLGCAFGFGLGVVGTVAFACGSPFESSAGGSTLLDLLGLALTDETFALGKCPAKVAYCIKVASTKENSSTISVGLGFIIGMALDCC